MDVELVVRAQGGDHDAFTDIATALHNRLYRVALNLLGDVQLAEDATQHTTLEMWRNLPRLREPQKIEAWAHRIVVNACRREGRKKARWIQVVAVAPEEDPTASQGFASVAHRDQLERGFRRLPMESVASDVKGPGRLLRSTRVSLNATACGDPIPCETTARGAGVMNGQWTTSSSIEHERGTARPLR